ncbi:MAG: HPr family phosphocarrier protein [Lachnospiraceae bacterium]|nr:HPr family phosphocarrier protein [Lachnospiraceae bacterium]
MKKRTVTVALDDSKGARPIAMLVQVASQYDASIYIDCDSRHVNAKSIMGMMTLALKNGDDVNVVTDGTDEDAAAESIEEYLTGQRAVG